jgi:hypothetical protein
MASVSRISGLRPVKHVSGGSYTGQANVYFVPAANADVIMVGDVVKLAGDSRSPTGVPTVARHAGGATEAAVGVVVGILFSGVGDTQNVPPVTDLNTPVYRRASTDRYLLVADDPGLIFEAQTMGATLAAVDVGLNAEVDVTAGNTASGASGMAVDLSTKATTATLPLKVVGFPYRPDNNIGDAFTNVYVRINNHQLNSGTGSAGV